MYRKIVIACLCISLLCIFLGLLPGEEIVERKPRIDVVFVLDTTGSMGGLIAGAKKKIWSIANTMATAKPTPEIRMGLVGYRDRGDQYITQITDLTDDIDAVYAKLMAFAANGGGDTPESVNQALNEAVTKMSWSEDEQTYRVIFLVGDCPPHMDYADDVKYPVSCKEAATQGIVINTVQCGSHSATTPIWQEIARKADGTYARVDQTGGAVEIATPFDEELVKLSRELDSTRLYYGDAKVQAGVALRAENAEVQYRENSPAAVADRVAFNASKAGKGNFLGVNELVDAVENDKVKLEEIEQEHLPKELQDKSIEEQKELIAAKAAERARLNEKINEVNTKRGKWLREQLEKQAGAKDGFDEQMRAAIVEQAAKKGLEMKAE